MQTIEHQNLIRLPAYRHRSRTMAFLEAVHRLIDGFPSQQSKQMLVEKLDIERLRCFVITVVDPVGGMLDQRPKIVIQIEHQETESVLSKTFGHLHRGRCFAGR